MFETTAMQSGMKGTVRQTWSIDIVQSPISNSTISTWLELVAIWPQRPVMKIRSTLTS
jgi:hypothetical protein